VQRDPLESASETAALITLLRGGAGQLVGFANRLEEVGSARMLLEREANLLTPQLLADAVIDITRWSSRGIRALTLLDADYPENLRAVHDRPPLLFVLGALERRDARSVAVIGSRRASPTGLERARAIAASLVTAGYTIFSGLAAGIDTAAHVAALGGRGRTVAVLGTGLERAYPPQNEALQQRIAASAAVVSQFWPEAGPTRRSFPQRNALMSGLTLATVVVEAGPTSGARTQIRAALRHGRPVLLARSLLEQPWAREVATRPGVEVIASFDELTDAMQRISCSDPLIA